MNKLPIIGISQARKLAGKRIQAGNREFIFGDEDSIKLGGQAIAMPLLDASGRRVAFFRSSLALGATADKIRRTSWLVGQKLHLKSKAFATAPQLWFNSIVHGRPDGIDFDFAATIHGCAPGKSWKDHKEQIEFGNGVAPTIDQRLKFARSLVQRLASLEAFGRKGFLHGDLSDGNIMLDVESGEVHLIDFDCFVFESPTLSKPKLHVDEGGSKGTPSYMPPTLEANTSLHVGPVSDRFARDMLLIELLAFQAGDPIDTSPLYWSGQDELLEDISAQAKLLQLDYLLDPSVFSLNESERPSSFQLATRLTVNVEDNTRQLLDASPWLPDELTPNANSSASTSSRQNERRDVGANGFSIQRKLPSFHGLHQQVIQSAPKLAANVMAASLTAGGVMARLAAMLLVTLAIIYMAYRCLFLISFPANFIAAAAFLFSIAWVGGVTGVWAYLGFEEPRETK
jgi:hypothetical protein